jgi:dsDNA-binding SOS-regulon protein
MEKVADRYKKHQESGEEQLAALIKQAGEEARARKREALDLHFKKLRAVIAEGVSRWKNSTPI